MPKKNTNEYNAFSFWGAPEPEKKTNYIKTNNIFITPNNSIKNELKKIDDSLKNKRNDSVVKKIVRREDEKKEVKKDIKKEVKNENENMLTRKLAIMKKNKSVDSSMF
jgi:hypothetical protein